ncbi:MAG: hypothetical protein V3V84_07855 [Candidatus Bathyarchaeia archaeon]
MISSTTIGDISGRFGIGLIAAPIAAKAASLAGGPIEETKAFYEIPIDFLFGIDGIGITFILSGIFLVQGIVIRHIQLKKEIKSNQPKQEKKQNGNFKSK